MTRWSIAFVVLATLLVGLGPTPPSLAASCAPAGGSPFGFQPHPSGVFTFTGKGWGHGIGMSQYGAEGAASTGCNHEQILTTYYQGVRVRQSDPARIRVGLFPNRPGGGPVQGVEIANRSGKTLSWELADSTWSQPENAVWTVRTRSDGAFLVQNGAGDRVIDGVGGKDSLLTIGVQDAIELPQKGRTYRLGTFRLLSRGAEGLTLAVALPVEPYLYGLREVPSSFELAAQQAQAVAARSYAVRSVQDGLRGNCSCHVYDSVWDQVYAGATNETTIWRDAVDDTRRKVLWYEEKVVKGFYASSHGGHSEAASFVWGSGPAFDYLQAIDDSNWDRASDNPYRRWRTSFSSSEVTKRLKRHPDTRTQVGSVLNLRVMSRGTSKRAGKVSVIGTKGQTTVSGAALRRALGLRSTLFSVRSNVGGIPLTGDWNASGTDGLGWFRNGSWALQQNDGKIVRFSFGRGGDIPVVGDWNGDGIDSIGVVRRGQWYLRNKNKHGTAHLKFRYGIPDDRPLIGDWNGDGRDTPAVVRENGRWYLNNRLSGGKASFIIKYGRVDQGDRPLSGDWDDDGATEVGVIRDGEWLLNSVTGGGRATWKFRYGRVDSGDLPVVGNWNGGNGDSVGVVREMVWRLRNVLAGGRADQSVDFSG